MSYTTVGQALYWLEKPSGMTVKNNRCEMIDLLNEVRQHFYLLYQDLQLFMDGEECFVVEDFPLDCNCKETYTGITLRPEYETVEAIWLNDRPIKMYDKWREYRDGIDRGCFNKLAMYDIETNFPTERELAPLGVCKYVKIKADDHRDCGKLVDITYIDSNGQEMREQLLLSLEYVRTSRKVTRIEPRGGIVLPPSRAGSVTIASECGRILSVYDPSELVPSYRRMKIEGVCCGDQVYVKASRRYRPLWFDNDVVETDNKLAIVAAARGITYNNSTRADGSYDVKAGIQFANAKAYLLGEKARHRGKATISELPQMGGRITRSGLNSKRGHLR